MTICVCSDCVDLAIDLTLLQDMAKESLEKADASRVGETEWGGSSRKAPLVGWFVLVGLLIGGIGLWAVSSMYRAQDGIRMVDEEKREIGQDLLQDQQDVKAIGHRMKQAVSDYLGARTIEEKLENSRHPQRVKPLMEKFYQQHQLAPREFVIFENLSAFALNSLPFVRAIISTDEEGKVLYLEQLPDGRFLIDWETDVGYQPIAWSDFLDQKPKQAVSMRVWVNKDNFYAYEFSDETKYQCYRITDPHKEGHVFTYVERGSALMSAIERNFDEGAKVGEQVALMLQIRYPDSGNSKRCVMIDRLVEDSWIHSKSAGHAGEPKE